MNGQLRRGGAGCLILHKIYITISTSETRGHVSRRVRFFDLPQKFSQVCEAFLDAERRESGFRLV